MENEIKPINYQVGDVVKTVDPDLPMSLVVDITEKSVRLQFIGIDYMQPIVFDVPIREAHKLSKDVNGTILYGHKTK